MELTFRNQPPVKILNLSGSFINTTVAPARQWLEDATADRPAYIVIDLSAVRFMDSTGLSTLVFAMKRARALRGDVRVCGLQQPVRMIFEMTRLDQIFEIFSQVDDAIQAFGVGEPGVIDKKDEGLAR
jgi:anti-sigma B factor antagonist